MDVNEWYTEVTCGLEGQREGEAKPSRSTLESGVTSGRLLEHNPHVGSLMVKALTAISAIGGLWGTRCGMWPTLAALTCAM